MVCYRPHNLRYRIRFCQKCVADIDIKKKGTQNRPLWNSMSNFRITAKDIAVYWKENPP